MHLLRAELRSLDETAPAVDLQQSRADIVVLSFTDSDLAVLAKAAERLRLGAGALRLASLADLRHPYSVDLYVEKVIAQARVVFVRLLGGLDYWRYGVEEAARAARALGATLAVVPGDAFEDARLDAASTLPREDLRRLWAYMQNGGIDNAVEALRFLRGEMAAEPAAQAALGVFRASASAEGFTPSPTLPHQGGGGVGGDPGSLRITEAPPPPLRGRVGVGGSHALEGAEGFTPSPTLPHQGGGGVGCDPGGFRITEAPPPPLRGRAGVGGGHALEGAEVLIPSHQRGGGLTPRVLIVFYRSAWLAGDTAPYEALADALGAQGFAVEALYVTSLKDPAALAPLHELLKKNPPDVILNATAFSARLDEGGTVFDACDAPVLQASVSLASPAQWANSPRGLSPSDLAMNVALPEVDGRVYAGAIAFKAPAERIANLEYAPQRAQPHAATVAHVARLAAAWATLRRTPNADKRLAFILSDYPAKGGRQGYAVGLDTYASVAEIAARLAAEGYAIDAPPADLAKRLSPVAVLPLARYRQLFAALPQDFARHVDARWGDPAEDCVDGVFHFTFLRLGESFVALQPDRGRTATRADDYHDGALPPRHGYVAFYFWLREVEQVHALVHVGAHGTLEWLPGKAVALSEACAPRAVLGALPVIYPFIVNNPGEAAQAKRRTSAVTLGHMTPPLMSAPTHGATAEIEGLMDEFAQARALDPRRARRLAELVLERARDSGLAGEAALPTDADEALLKLDAWLCDLKEMRIGDGLHVFGQAAGEMDGLVAALAGRRVAPGPGGAPSRGRLDVLPTGRNLYSLDPRSVPTRTAWELGVKAGEAFVAAYAQDHGESPKRVVFDLWGSSAMRTGGEDLAQALWLIGARPLWDHASHRVSGYEVLTLAALGRCRVDVTLRISGLFRDVFPEQIALFHAAAAAVAARDEPDEENPLRGAAPERVFGQAPGAYGTGVGRAALAGAWESRDDLGEVYLDATRFAYAGGEARESGAFRAKVAEAQAFVHVQDMAGQDVLDSDAFAEHEGGFAAAAASLGASPDLYHLDATDPDKPKARTLAQETARVLRARAANPAWLKGQMRHGYRGAAEIAETVDNLYLFAATTDAVADRHFDLLFEAVVGEGEVRDFLIQVNPQAAVAIADRFADAAKRGLWTTRRNSVEPLLQALRGAA